MSYIHSIIFSDIRVKPPDSTASLSSEIVPRGVWEQMIAISMLLLLEPGAAVTLVNPATFMPIAKGLLYVSTVLTVTSGSGYLKAAWPALMGKST